MKRYSLSKTHSKNYFRSSYDNIKAINIAETPQRGGFRI